MRDYCKYDILLNSLRICNIKLKLYRPPYCSAVLIKATEWGHVRGTDGLSAVCHSEWVVSLLFNASSSLSQLQLWAAEVSCLRFRRIFSLLVQSTPRATCELRPVATETKELVMWWMRRWLSGGRRDWGCDVSPNTSVREDEKTVTAGRDFQSVCVCAHTW